MSTTRYTELAMRLIDYPDVDIMFIDFDRSTTPEKAEQALRLFCANAYAGRIDRLPHAWRLETECRLRVNRDQTELSAPCPVYPQQLPNSGHRGSAASGPKD
jgi:hypothetical protein